MGETSGELEYGPLMWRNDGRIIYAVDPVGSHIDGPAEWLEMIGVMDDYGLAELVVTEHNYLVERQNEAAITPHPRAQEMNLLGPAKETTYGTPVL